MNTTLPHGNSMPAAYGGDAPFIFLPTHLQFDKF